MCMWVYIGRPGWRMKISLKYHHDNVKYLTNKYRFAILPNNTIEILLKYDWKSQPIRLAFTINNNIYDRTIYISTYIYTLVRTFVRTRIHTRTHMTTYTPLYPHPPRSPLSLLHHHQSETSSDQETNLLNGLTPTTDVIGDNRSTQTFERTKENTISILTLTRPCLYTRRGREREREGVFCSAEDQY